MSFSKACARLILILSLAGIMMAAPAIAQDEGEQTGANSLYFEIASGTVADADTTGMAAAYTDFYSEGGFDEWFAKTRLGRSGIGTLFLAGGQFMWPLLVSLLVGLVFIFERLWTLSRARTNTRKLMFQIQKALRSEGIDAATKVCERTRGPIAAILHAGLLKSHRGPADVKEAIETAGSIEMAFLEKGLTAIAAIVSVAPMLGFLGTVSGMINAFAAIAASDQVSAKLVASGISEALITTATGLVIGIPTSLFHSYFVGQVDRFVVEMEETSAELVSELVDLGI
jgi:biopolymer transport protein ExbB